MIPRLETIRRHLSWCPNAATARTCWQGAVPGDEGVGEARAVGGGRAAMGGAFMDYGPADISTATSVAMALAGSASSSSSYTSPSRIPPLEIFFCSPSS